jgi:hypothetical protein
MSKAAIRSLILVLLLVVILVGLFFLLRPAPTQDTATTSDSATNEPGEKTIDVAIQQGMMNPDTITVNEGDHVNLQLTSDSPVMFHLHGYDKYIDIKPGEPAQLTFDATITGRFAIENHTVNPPELLGQILVQPR